MIVSEAHQEARSIMRGAQSERERLVLEARRITMMMRSALGLLEEGAGSPEKWPDRGDTSEFKAVIEPVIEDEPVVDEPSVSRDFTWG